MCESLLPAEPGLEAGPDGQPLGGTSSQNTVGGSAQRGPTFPGHPSAGSSLYTALWLADAMATWVTVSKNVFIISMFFEVENTHAFIKINCH